MAVIPKGSTFTLTGDTQNDFLGVSYHGFGWVYGPLIVPAGQSSGDPVVVGEARTSVNVNLRSGPSTGHAVLRVVSYGSAVNVSNTVQNGFRYVVHQGLAGWMADQYLVWGTHQPPGETFTTTANLNLRAEPNLSARILLVMQSGSTVAGLDDWSNGFRKVSYNGTVGWAATAYLN
jgi:D-alanyl-D-alanine carboxypeptidase